MKQGGLHWIYITSDIESHQLMFPRKYHEAMLHMLHDDYGHQGLCYVRQCIVECITVTYFFICKLSRGFCTMFLYMH